MRIGGIALIILLKIEGYVTYTLIRRMCELLGRSKSLPVFAYLMPLFSIYYSYKGPIGDHLFVRSPMRMWYVHEVFFKKQRLELCLLSKKLIFTRLSEPVRPYTRQITIKWRKRGGGGGGCDWGCEAETPMISSRNSAVDVRRRKRSKAWLLLGWYWQNR